MSDVNTTGYTPGPWQVIDNRDLNDNYWIGTDQFTSHAEVRAGCSEARELGKPLANAYLIAAAPDLLEALEYVLSAHGEQLTDAFDQAQRAITKAKGSRS